MWLNIFTNKEQVNGMTELRDEVRRMLIESQSKKSVGVMILAEDTNKVLLLKRGWNPHKGKWSILSGGMEEGEEKLETLKREIGEEIGVDADEKLKLTFIRTEDWGNKDFHYYKGLTKEEFIPTLDNENEDYGWFSKDDLPSPLYPKTEDKIKELCKNET